MQYYYDFEFHFISSVFFVKIGLLVIFLNWFLGVTQIMVGVEQMPYICLSSHG